MTISNSNVQRVKTGPQSGHKNQSEFQDFYEVYPISKTLMHSHEFQNVDRFILGLPYKQKNILILTRGWNFHRSESQTKFKRIFVRDQDFNKNTSYSYNPKDYKRPPLVISIPIFQFFFFFFFLISYNQFNGFSFKNQFSGWIQSNQIKQLPPQHMQVILFLIMLIIHLLKQDCVISCICFF